MRKMIVHYAGYIAWTQALVATLGSLYFSQILHLPPCVLCWYQRIFMYPLCLIIPIGLLRKDKNLPLFVLPLVLIGGAISIYHNLLYYKVIPEAIAPCTTGVSCTTKFFEWFGFVTIPFLSLVAFVIIAVSMVILLREQRNQDN